MPSRNVSKEQAPESYYHVYARGSNKQKIFIEAADYKYYLGLFDRYLSGKQAVSKTGEPYPQFSGKVSILAYCLMSNHFHLLVYQNEVPFLEKLMRSVMTSYSRYFNLKYKRTGSLFESRYKAVRIDNDAYLQHVTRYIHLNPRYWERYRYSSLKYYREEATSVWLNPNIVLGLFSSRQEYLQFVADYESQRDMMAELKYQLADH